MVGPLPKAPGGFTHIFVVVDKFTKWIEARPLTKITSAQAVDSFLSILHQFVVPNTIVTDNGTQFTGKKFTQFCDDYGIQVAWAAVAHARTNDQVARANGMIWRVEKIIQHGRAGSVVVTIVVVITVAPAPLGRLRGRVYRFPPGHLAHSVSLPVFPTNVLVGLLLLRRLLGLRGQAVCRRCSALAASSSGTNAREEQRMAGAMSAWEQHTGSAASTETERERGANLRSPRRADWAA